MVQALISILIALQITAAPTLAPVAGCRYDDIENTASAVSTSTNCDAGGVVGYSETCSFERTGYRCQNTTCGAKGEWDTTDVLCFALGPQCSFIELFMAVCNFASCQGITPSFATTVWTDTQYVTGSSPTETTFNESREGSALGPTLTGDLCISGFTLNKNVLFICTTTRGYATLDDQLCVKATDAPATDVPATPSPPVPTPTPIITETVSTTGSLSETETVTNSVTPTKTVFFTATSTETDEATNTTSATNILTATVTQRPPMEPPVQAPLKPGPVPQDDSINPDENRTATVTLVANDDSGSSFPLWVVILIILGVCLLLLCLAWCCKRREQKKNGEEAKQHDDPPSDVEHEIESNLMMLRNKELSGAMLKKVKTWEDSMPFDPATERENYVVSEDGEEGEEVVPPPPEESVLKTFIEDDPLLSERVTVVEDQRLLSSSSSESDELAMVATPLGLTPRKQNLPPILTKAKAHNRGVGGAAAAHPNPLYSSPSPPLSGLLLSPVTAKLRPSAELTPNSSVQSLQNTLRAFRLGEPEIKNADLSKPLLRKKSEAEEMQDVRGSFSSPAKTLKKGPLKI